MTCVCVCVWLVVRVRAYVYEKRRERERERGGRRGRGKQMTTGEHAITTRQDKIAADDAAEQNGTHLQLGWMPLTLPSPQRR